MEKQGYYELYTRIMFLLPFSMNCSVSLHRGRKCPNYWPRPRRGQSSRVCARSRPPHRRQRGVGRRDYAWPTPPRPAPTTPSPPRTPCGVDPPQAAMLESVAEGFGSVKHSLQNLLAEVEFLQATVETLSRQAAPKPASTPSVAAAAATPSRRPEPAASLVPGSSAPAVSSPPHAIDQWEPHAQFR